MGIKLLPVSDVVYRNSEQGLFTDNTWGQARLPIGEPDADGNPGIVRVPIKEMWVATRKPKYVEGPAHGLGTSAFWEGAADGNKVYFAPYNSKYIGIYDSDSGEFIRGAAHGQGTRAYHGAVNVGGEIFFIPNRNNVRIGILDTVSGKFSLGSAFNNPRITENTVCFYEGKAGNGGIMLYPAVNTDNSAYDEEILRELRTAVYNPNTDTYEEYGERLDAVTRDQISVTADPLADSDENWYWDPWYSGGYKDPYLRDLAIETALSDTESHLSIPDFKRSNPKYFGASTIGGPEWYHGGPGGWTSHTYISTLTSYDIFTGKIHLDKVICAYPYNYTVDGTKKWRYQQSFAGFWDFDCTYSQREKIPWNPDGDNFNGYRLKPRVPPYEQYAYGTVTGSKDIILDESDWGPDEPAPKVIGLTDLMKPYIFINPTRHEVVYDENNGSHDKYYKDIYAIKIEGNNYNVEMISSEEIPFERRNTVRFYMGAISTKGGKVVLVPHDNETIDTY